MQDSETKLKHWMKTGMGVLAAFALALALLWISVHLAKEHGEDSLRHLVLNELASALLGSAFIWIAFELWKNMADDEAWERRIQRADQAWEKRTHAADKLWEERVQAEKEAWTNRTVEWQHILNKDQRQWEKRIESLANNAFWGLLNNDMPRPILDGTRDLILDCNFVRSDLHVWWDIESYIDSNYEEVDFECILLHASMSYNVTNVSREAKGYPPFVYLPNPADERLKRLCKLHYIRYTKEGDSTPTDFLSGTRSYLIDPLGKVKGSADSTTGEPYVRYPPDDKPVMLDPGKSLHFEAGYTMAKRLEDSEFQQSVFPSMNMKITVADRTNDENRRVFARAIHPRPVKRREPLNAGCPTYVFDLQGSVLPHQGILIWWEFAGARGTSGSPAHPQ